MERVNRSLCENKATIKWKSQLIEYGQSRTTLFGREKASIEIRKPATAMVIEWDTYSSKDEGKNITYYGGKIMGVVATSAELLVIGGSNMKGFIPFTSGR